VVCTGDARQLRINISMHSRSLLARAPVRNSLNLALPSDTRTCSQFTEYKYVPPPQKNISHRIYTIHVDHLFWFQNRDLRRKVRDFHARQTHSHTHTHTHTHTQTLKHSHRNRQAGMQNIKQILRNTLLRLQYCIPVKELDGRYFMPACLPVCLPTCLPACLPPSLPACLPAYPPACLTACLPSWQPARSEDGRA